MSKPRNGLKTLPEVSSGYSAANSSYAFTSYSFKDNIKSPMDLLMDALKLL